MFIFLLFTVKISHIWAAMWLNLKKHDYHQYSEFGTVWLVLDHFRVVYCENLKTGQQNGLIRRKT